MFDEHQLNVNKYKYLFMLAYIMFHALPFVVVVMLLLVIVTNFLFILLSRLNTYLTRNDVCLLIFLRFSCSCIY